MTFDSIRCREAGCSERTQQTVELETASGTDRIDLCAIHAATLLARARGRAKVVAP